MPEPLGLWWQPCPGGARLLRVLGDTPCPSPPAQIEGLPTVELGPYCFAEQPRFSAAGLRFFAPPGTPQAPAAWPHAICGNFVERIALPPSLRVAHSAAFYNCRRLARLDFGPGLDALGSDLFTNCRALTVFAVHAAPDAATGLKKLLRAVSADIMVHFCPDGGGAPARLFYPEYYEFLDENTPAHIFNHSIEGEGYRYRQCFTAQGGLDYAAYDACFAQATVGEPPAKLCRLALGRLTAPFALSDAAQQAYAGYLRGHAADACRLAIQERDAGALRLLCGEGLLDAPARQAAAAQCAAAGWSAGAALVLGTGKRPKKRYDFDDFG